MVTSVLASCCISFYGWLLIVSSRKLVRGMLFSKIKTVYDFVLGDTVSRPYKSRIVTWTPFTPYLIVKLHNPLLEANASQVFRNLH